MKKSSSYGGAIRHFHTIIPHDGAEGNALELVANEAAEDDEEVIED